MTPTRWTRSVIARTVPLVGCLLLACSGSAPVDAGSLVASIAIAPASATVAVGATLSVSATPVSLSGQSVPGQSITWTSSNPTIAAVSDAGVVSGLAVGAVTIRATAGGKSGSVAVTVTVGSVSVSPAIVVVDRGSTRSLTATVLDARGTVMASEPVAWLSSNPAVVTVGPSGMLTAIATGTAIVTVSSGGLSSIAVVNVLEALNDYGFSDPVPLAQFGTLGGGWQVAYNTFGFGSRVADAAAPVSPPDVLQVRYPAGFPGGGAPVTVYLAVPGQPSALFARFSWKVGSGWQGHSSNINKVAFFKLGTNDQLAIVMYGPPGGPYYLDAIPEFAGISPTYYRHILGTPAVALGQWHSVEVMLNKNAGSVQWWMDGALVGNATMPFNAEGFSEFQFSPTWGGLGDVKARDDYYWFDHVHVSTGR